MPENRKQIRTNPLAYRVLQFLLRLWLERQFRLSADMPAEVRDLKPPYLLLPNHQGFWDPFMAALYIRHHVYYIASDAIFRSPFFKFILQLLGAIPKTKARSDIDALKHIFDLRDRGAIIGIFPEGRRTWDGVTLPLVYSTSKLIRMLRIPVVTVVFKGGFLSQPRWGYHIQKGSVRAEYRLLFGADETRNMKVDEIHKKLTEALRYDEYEYQAETSLEFHGEKPAENIEQVLYACPSCGAIGGIYSRNDLFGCNKCGYLLRYASTGLFMVQKGRPIFNTVRDWNRWQYGILCEWIDKMRNSGEVYLSDGNLEFYTGFKSRKPRLLARGSLNLSLENLSVRTVSGEEVARFKLEQLSGLNIQNKENLEFYHKGVLYLISDPKKSFSAYKWLNALEYLLKDKAPAFQVL